MPVTHAVLPVKGFGAAKQRLTGDVADAARAALAAAMVADVVDALGAVAALDGLVVVTGDVRASAIALGAGALIVDDDDRGHNPAARAGVAAAVAAGAERVMLVAGDCPALDPGEVSALLADASEGVSVLVIPDRHGTGTNGLVLFPPTAIGPAFGPGSHERHLGLAAAAGVRARTASVQSLAWDVDTAEDLAGLAGALAARPDAAPRTRAELARLALAM